MKIKIALVLALSILSAHSAFASGPSLICTSGGNDPQFVVEIGRNANSSVYNVKLKKHVLLGGQLRWIVTPLTGKLELATPAAQETLQLFGRNESGLQHIGRLMGRPQIENAQLMLLTLDNDPSQINLPVCKPLAL